MSMMVVDPIYVLQHFFEYAMSSYDALDIYKYPLLILAIVGYIYLSTKSSTLAILTVIVALSVFGGTGMFAQTFVLNNLFAILTVLGLAALFLGLILKREISEVLQGE
jgi:hypothetical protein